MIKIIITKLPIAGFSYFQWLLLGLHELEQQGKIKLSYNIPLVDRIVLLWTNSKWIAGAARRLVNIVSPLSDYMLCGSIESEGRIRKFAVDPKDSPYLYDVTLLENVDTYFKLQCPKEFDPNGFRLSADVVIPWFDISFEITERNGQKFSRVITDKVYSLRHKIKPGMIGPRRLAWSCKYPAMKKQYNKYLESQTVKREAKLCAYFRNAEGPRPTNNLTIADPDLEWDLMALYPSLNHPNIKRAAAVRLMRNMNDVSIDGRLMYDKDTDSGITTYHPELKIPLPEFCDWIAKYNYNLNISGYRMSIPNRFIESFIAGTGIMTDKLSIKWYLPFEEEVVETVTMGYEPLNRIDWEGFKKDIASLPDVGKERIIELYSKKWSPIAFASYVIKETLKDEV